MKKFLYSFLVTLTLIVTGCKYDDSALWDSVNDLDYRVTTLENLCAQLNTNVSSLQSLVYVMNEGDYITSINSLYENGKVVGYTITFAKNPSITIYHGNDGTNGKDGRDGKDGADGKDGIDGKDGADGKDGIDGKDGVDGKDGLDGKDGTDGSYGYTPIIGVKKDSDGHFYWTLDGEWLLDTNGNKVLAEGIPGQDGKDGANGKDGLDGKDGADGKDGKDGLDGIDGADGKDGQNGQNGSNGKDGITPQFKIEDGDWYISLDNGMSWEYLGRATGADGADGKDGVDGKDGQNGSDGIDGKDGKDGIDGKDGQNGTDGDSVFSSIDTSHPDYVIFILKDGTQLKIPRKNISETDFSIEFDKTEFIVQPGQMYIVNYTITGGDENTQINVIEKNGIQSTIHKISNTKGYIDITAPNYMTLNSAHELIILVNDGGNRTLMKTLNFIKGVATVSNYTTVANSEDTKVSVKLLTNLDNYTIQIPEKAQSWIAANPRTRAEIREDELSFSLTPNPDQASRTTLIKIIEDGGIQVETMQIIQFGTSTKFVNLELAGKLSSTLGSSTLVKNAISELIITGYINSNDCSYIRSLPNLSYLDLSGVLDTTLPNESQSDGLFGKKIKILYLPQNLQKVPQYMLKHAIDFIQIPETVTIIGKHAFDGCTLQRPLILPENLVTLESGAFWGLTILSGDFIIPDNVTTIDSNAFSLFKLSGNIVIGKNSKALYADIFDNNLKIDGKIYIKNPIPPDIRFFPTQQEYLGVPRGSKAKYVNSQYWGYDYFSIIEEVDFEELGY